MDKTALPTGCACCIAGAVPMFSDGRGGKSCYAETYDLECDERFCEEAKTHFHIGEKIKLDDFETAGQIP